MLRVSPIKDRAAIELLKMYFLQSNQRDYLFFVISINLPLKVNEIAAFRVRDVIGRGELRLFHINGYDVCLPAYITPALTAFIEQHRLDDDDYLFQSAKTKQPLTRQQVYRIIHEAVMTLGINSHIGIQSLKKTFAYHAYSSQMDIYTLQYLLGHQSKYETYKFIEVEPPVKGELCLNL